MSFQAAFHKRLFVRSERLEIFDGLRRQDDFVFHSGYIVAIFRGYDNHETMRFDKQSRIQNTYKTVNQL